MPPTMNSSSSPPVERLVRVPLDQLHPHPRNANRMSADQRQKLAANIARTKRCPPLIVRPDPDRVGHYQILDGHQRDGVVRDLGWTEVDCYVWPCDDEGALLLLSTLNRLRGEDEPHRRAELLTELSALIPADVLSGLLPESAAEIEDALALLDFDAEALLAELTATETERAAAAPRLLSVVVDPADEVWIERAMRIAGADLSGRNRRGRALAAACRAYLEGRDDEHDS